MIRTINKPFLLMLLLVAIIVGSSCKKSYLDVNKDPNRVTDDNVTAELIFPAAEVKVGRNVADNAGNNVGSRAGSFFSQWIGYTAPNGQFVPQQNLISYNIDYSYGDNTFKGYYDILFDLHQAEVKALDISDGDTALAGASIVLSAKLFQELVDIFGDVPYTQAFNVSSFKTPKYDKSQDIYKALQGRLDTAIIYLKLPQKAAFAKVDIINHGDADKWIAFANTLKLRLLIRQSEVPGFDPSSEIAKIINKGGVLGAGKSISVNPGYVNDVSKQNPYYDANGWTTTGTQANLSTNANNYILNILSTTNDPRLSRFFFPAGFSSANGYVGNTFGAPSASLASASNSSYFGPVIGGELDGSNVGTGYSKDQYIYPSFESLFLYAEAVARGWIAGDRNAALAAAITESFIWTGVPNAVTAASAYIAANPKLTTLDSANTPLARAKIVVYQKYIANTEIDPLESFLDQNRLHFLTDKSYISVFSGKVSNIIPLRLLYPQSEYTTNSANTPKQVVGDAFTSKLFWEQ
ncbi:MAG: SusD/RagB family nutrient-binding outer membrane lipoprotein [Ginsengibacter sp.]